MPWPLLKNRFAPVTNTMAFFRVAPEVLWKQLTDWWIDIRDGRADDYDLSAVHVDDVQGALECLLPLSVVRSTRHVVIPAGGGWCAYFNNAWRGSDPMSEVSVMTSRMGCMATIVNASCGREKPYGIPSRPYGAWAVRLYDPSRGERPGWATRTVGIWEDDSGWEWVDRGTPYNNEPEHDYDSEPVRRRFGPDRIAEFMAMFDAHPFEEGWYLPQNTDCVYRAVDLAPPPTVWPVSLADARTGGHPPPPG